MSKFYTKFGGNKVSIAKKEAIAIESISTANLQDLKQMLPYDVEANPDFLHIVFNLAVVNQANLNFDGITTPTALAIAKNWSMKQLNIEHDRDRIIGVITGAGFSSYPDNKLLSEDEVRGMENPFNIVASAIVWRVAGDVAEILEESSEDGICQDISASWELGFDDYVISVGSEKINESRMVFDPKEISFLEGFLPCNGGTGYYQDKKLSRVIIGSVIPLGAGLTTSPAADVKGLVIADCGKMDHKDEENDASAKIIELKEEVLTEIAANTQKKENKCENNENKISHEQEITVNKITMVTNFTSIEQIRAHVEAGTLMDQKELFNFLQQKVAEAGVKFDEAQAEKATLETSAKDAAEKLSQKIAELDKTKSEFEELKSAIAEKEKQQRNDARIDDLGERFELNQKKIKHLKAQFNDLDDEAYAAWLEDTEEFLTPREQKESKASVEDDAISLLDKAKANIDIPNTQGTPEEKDVKNFGLTQKDIKISFQ